MKQSNLYQSLKKMTLFLLLLAASEPHEVVDGGHSSPKPHKVVGGLCVSFLATLEPHEVVAGERSSPEPHEVVGGFGHFRATRSCCRRAFIVRATRSG